MTITQYRTILQVAVTLLLTFLMAIGCTKVVKLSDSERDLNMDTILRELPNYPEVTVTVQTGVEYWRNGEITLDIQGSGILVVKNVRSGELRTFTGQIDEEQVKKLGIDFANAGFLTLQPLAATRSPGDEPVLLMMSRDGKQLYKTILWHGDRYASAGLDLILKRSDELIIQITNGVLPFGRT